MPKCRICDKNVPPTANYCPKCGASIDRLPSQAVEDLEQQIRSLVEQGQKLNAVKLYKERTGVDLKEAKDAVEALAHGKSLISPIESVDDMKAEVLRLLRQGRKLDACKMYKKLTGVPLMEAKRAVEALAEKHGVVSKGGGCAGVLVAIMVAAVIAGMTVF